MARSVKCLSFKLENLDQSITFVCNFSTGKAGAHWLAGSVNSVSSRLVRDPISNVKWKATEEDTHLQTLASVCMSMHMYTHIHEQAHGYTHSSLSSAYLFKYCYCQGSPSTLVHKIYYTLPIY